MCDPGTIGLILTAVGAGTGAVANDQALRARDRETARGIAERASLQRQASSRVGKNIQDLQASNPEADRQAAQKDFMAALDRAQLTNGGTGLNSTGAVSNRFAEDVGAARTAATGENTALAGNLARIDAPNLQRVREGQATASTASDLAELGRQSSISDYLTQLRAASQNPNPLLTGLGEGLSAFGGQYAQRAPKVKTPKVPVSPSPGGF